MKNQRRSTLIVLAVVVIVAGVAWIRSARERNAHGTDSPSPPVAAPAPTPSGEEQIPGGARTADATPKLPRVVDVGADKCIPCKQMAPILVELRKEYEGRVSVEFVDVWKDPKAGDPYHIRMIPTQVFFDTDGNEVWRHEGFLPKADFIAKFAELGVK